MDISHVISSIDIKSGGPSRSASHLLDNLANQNKDYQYSLYTKLSDSPIIKKFSNLNCKLFFFRGLKFGIARGLTLAINKNHHDILHFHGVWDLILIQAYLSAKINKTPFIISPRGMMEPWPLKQGKLKKQLFRWFVVDKILKDAACIHATAQSEAENLRRLGFKNPIAVIPNGINLPEFPDYIKKSNSKKKILFLSRIHVKKGIENLIEAWSLLDIQITKNWCVEIIGNGDSNYITTLKDKIRECGFDESITIKDPVFGVEKIKAYQSADLFVLPTYSENFGIVIAEALASKVPVITTKGTPWDDLINYKCGDWIDIGASHLKTSLEKLMTITDDERLAMGENGRLLIMKKYSMDAVASDFHILYKWLINKKNKPNFIV